MVASPRNYVRDGVDACRSPLSPYGDAVSRIFWMVGVLERMGQQWMFVDCEADCLCSGNILSVPCLPSSEMGSVMHFVT